MQQVIDTFQRFAQRPFLIDSTNDRQYSYQEFYDLAANLADKLLVLGVKRGERIGILLENCTEFATLYFSCLCLGTVAVPINPQLHAKEIEFILNNSGIKTLVFSKATESLVPADLVDKKLRTLKISRAADAGTADHWSAAEPQPLSGKLTPFEKVTTKDLFSITFTSGTTGLPKGVVHRIENLLGSATEFNDALGFGMDDRFYHVFSMAYMAGFLNTLICPFLAGASVVIGPAFDATMALRFWNVPMKYGVNTLWLVPTILSSLLKLDRSEPGKEYCRKHIRNLCVGTAPLPAKVQKDFEAVYGVRALESYGLSETLFVATNRNSEHNVVGSVGRTLPNIQVKFEQSEAAGEAGEVLVQSRFNMVGYLDYQTLEPDPTTSSTWFPSGDLGYQDQDGRLFISGRKKDLIIKGGLNVSPRSVENVLLEHDCVEQVAVIGLPHEFYGEEVVAVLKLKPGYELASVRPELDAMCKKGLNAPSVPSKYLAVDELPASSNGKIQKNKLRDSLLGTPTLVTT